ncbi:MAG: hypothetical protein CVU36_18445 [Betaproteobacteria bacterium HGW-Betaproteobacteria-9]|jgi:hypothetical protein|nr:MAG: hypothetical protein CVU36_18445 [Betaproteobacteria bacterium HGW-Betaproteobacteria-9]
MRLFIALLLCLTIPFQGWAAGAGVPAPCPMGEMMAMHASAPADAANDVMADLADCCNDAATAALTGKLCKTGQGCQAPTGWFVSPSQPVIQALPTSTLLVTATPAPPSGASASVWRPPTL